MHAPCGRGFDYLKGDIMRRYRVANVRRFLVIVILLILVAILGILTFCSSNEANSPSEPGETPVAQGKGLFEGKASTPAPTATPVPTPTPSPTPYFYTPKADESALPSVFGYKRELEVNGERADSFTSQEDMSFGPASEYTALEGIITFRGNNYRDDASYGTAAVSAKTLTLAWTVSSGSMSKGISGEGSWTGSGWVGQPLIVRWPDSTKKIMNLYDEAKNKPGLVEVILATMDGNVYFLDLETGKPTRDKLKIGMPFKGAGALDPRGYPLLYLGSGDGYDDDARDTRALVYSLIDFKRLYEFGKRKDPFALRTWHAYDSSPLIHAASDTLFYPGENGILYRIKLNTQFDAAAGTVSVSPSDTVKYRYSAKRASEKEYWLGYEDSAAIWGHYLYLTDNAGLMQCIDLNTMDIVWVQDTWDDSNGSPVLEVSEAEHTAYLYAGTSLHWKKDANSVGDVAFFKIDAVTGKVVWEDVRHVSTVSGVSGGIQATAILGKNSISDLVLIPYSRYPSEKPSRGALVALDKETGAERWQFATVGYSWGSPVAVYDAAGNAYIVLADTRGNIYLLNGSTGELLDTLTVGTEEARDNFEASPAVFGDTIVIGSRSAKIYGIKIN